MLVREELLVHLGHLVGNALGLNQALLGGVSSDVDYSLLLRLDKVGELIGLHLVDFPVVNDQVDVHFEALDLLADDLVVLPRVVLHLLHFLLQLLEVLPDSINLFILVH